MNIRKLAFMAILLSLFAGFAFADHVSMQDQSYVYGENPNEYITIECDDQGVGENCPNPRSNAENIKVKICEEGDYVVPGTEAASSDPKIYRINKRPDDVLVECGIGKFSNIEIEFDDDQTKYYKTETIDGTLNIKPNSNTANYAPYLRIRMETGATPNGLKSMYLTSEKWETNPSSDEPSGVAMIRETDSPSSDERATYQFSNGIIEGDLASQVDCTRGEMDSGGGNCQVSDGGTDFQDADCKDDPCSIATKGFTNNNGFSSVFSYPTDVSPLHLRGEYFPQGSTSSLIAGELAVGVNAKPNDDRHGFWLCRDGSDGVSIDTNPDSSTDGFYRCYVDGKNWNLEPQTPSGSTPDPYTWVSVETCEDGVDNNGEDGTDLEDPICGGNQENAEAFDCSEPYVAEDGTNIEEKSALYGEPDPTTPTYSPAGVECNYEYADTDISHPAEENDPVEFECTETGGQVTEVAEAQNYGGPTPDKADEFCQNRYYAGTEGFFQDPMPAVQYFVSKEDIPIGPSKWAASSGFKPSYGFQTLHQAEKEYSSSEPHSFDTWDAKDMQNLDGYQNGNEENFEDAWQTANAGSQSNEVYSEGKLGEDTAFSGGFAGVCSPDKDWLYNSYEWLCDYTPTGFQDITVNTYQLETTDIPGSYAGFQVKKSEIEKWGEAHNANPFGGEYTDPVQVRATCWHGGVKEQPPHDERVNLTAEANSNGPTYVIGEIPERSNAPSQNGEYTCVFGFRQKVDSRSGAGIPSITILFEDGSGGDGDKNQGWITEGTNFEQNGRIRSFSESIPVPSGSEDEQSWLQSRQANTISGDVWPNFVISEMNKCTSRHPLVAKDLNC